MLILLITPLLLAIIIGIILTIIAKDITKTSDTALKDYYKRNK